MSSPKLNCQVGNCKNLADYSIYPDNRRKEELKVNLCERHRLDVDGLKEPRETLYRAATTFVTRSLV